MSYGIYYNVNTSTGTHGVDWQQVTVVRDLNSKKAAIKAARQAALKHGHAWIDEYNPAYGLTTVYEVSRADVEKRSRVHNIFTTDEENRKRILHENGFDLRKE